MISMNMEKLDLAFRQKSEMEVVRLLTCNFDVGTFSLVEKSIPNSLAYLLRQAIKFRSHLSVEPTTLVDFDMKIQRLSATVNKHFEGRVHKRYGYSGKLLTESKTFLGTPDELVSFNEYSYVAKLYPWYIKPSNPAFESVLDQYSTKQVFLCLPSFDLDSLRDKEDVVSVSEEKIVLKGKITLPVVRVD